MPDQTTPTPVSKTFGEDACRVCGQADPEPYWLDGSPTSDTWGCRSCGAVWTITIEHPGQVQR